MIFNCIAPLLTVLALSFRAQIALAFAPSLQQRSPTKQMLDSNARYALNGSTGQEDERIENESSFSKSEQSRRELFKSLPSTTAALAAMLGGATAATVPDRANAFFFKKPIINAPPANEAVLGPLNDLVGKWEGNQGFVMISVPAPGSHPSDNAKFIELSFPYRETIEIQSIGPDGALNRGGSIDQVNGVCNYTKTVWATDKFPNEPKKQTIIHKENGMFFYLDDITANPGPGPVDPADKAPFSIGRSAVIPHGNTAMIFGGVEESNGPPEISDITTLPFTTPKTAFPFGYGESFRGIPSNTLQDALDNGPPVVNTVHFSMDSKNEPGGVLNTNFITNRADTRRYQADMWVEDLGNNGKQLQYVETASIFFHFNEKKEINWPHVMVNTLKKVE